MYNFNKPNYDKMAKTKMPKKDAMMSKMKKPAAPAGNAASIIAMLKKLPSKTLNKIYSALENMEPEDLDMLGKRKYPGE
jgi:hypothetical protein